MNATTIVYLLNPSHRVRDLIIGILGIEDYCDKSLHIVDDEKTRDPASGWRMTLAELQRIHEYAISSGLVTNFEVATKRAHDGSLRLLQKSEWEPSAKKKKKRARKIAAAVRVRSSQLDNLESSALEQSTFGFITE